MLARESAEHSTHTGLWDSHSTGVDKETEARDTISMDPILVTPIPSNGWTLACLRARVFNHCAPSLSSPPAPEDFPSDILWLQVQPAQLKGPPVQRQRWGWGRTASFPDPSDKQPHARSYLWRQSERRLEQNFQTQSIAERSEFIKNKEQR